MEADGTISAADKKILKKRLGAVDIYVSSKSKGAFSVINMFKYFFIFHRYAEEYHFPIHH